MLKEKSYICVCGPRESFDRVPRKMLEWAMRKIGRQEVLVRSVMSLHEGAKKRVRVDFELSGEFEVKVGMRQGSVLSPFLFALVVDVVTEFARESALSVLLYADEIVIMSETIMGLRDKVVKWKEALRAKV